MRHFVLFPGNGFYFAIGYLLFLPVTDTDSIPLYSYFGEKRPRGADGIGVPSRRQTVVRSLPEESADTLHSHARIIPCFTSLNSKLIDQTALVALSGVSCNATPDGLRVVSIPTNSPASLAGS